MRNTTTTTTAVAVVLLALTACADAIPAPDMDAPEAPEVTAALDWAEAADMEFGAAPFSPPAGPTGSATRSPMTTRASFSSDTPIFSASKPSTG
ncbi:MAG: hypothetical protein F4012_06880 [Gemmatimonadales bacterium]|nr:hypothetical protein [Gemmatimonadales bacterium]